MCWESEVLTHSKLRRRWGNKGRTICEEIFWHWWYVNNGFEKQEAHQQCMCRQSMSRQRLGSLRDKGKWLTGKKQRARRFSYEGQRCQAKPCLPFISFLSCICFFLLLTILPSFLLPPSLPIFLPSLPLFLLFFLLFFLYFPFSFLFLPFFLFIFSIHRIFSDYIRIAWNSLCSPGWQFPYLSLSNTRIPDTNYYTCLVTASCIFSIVFIYACVLRGRSVFWVSACD